MEGVELESDDWFDLLENRMMGINDSDVDETFFDDSDDESFADNAFCRGDAVSKINEGEQWEEKLENIN